MQQPLHCSLGLQYHKIVAEQSAPISILTITVGQAEFDGCSWTTEPSQLLANLRAKPVFSLAERSSLQSLSLILSAACSVYKVNAEVKAFWSDLLQTMNIMD
jgi:hypothetical protein